jgi:hypothetical protein
MPACPPTRRCEPGRSYFVALPLYLLILPKEVPQRVAHSGLKEAATDVPISNTNLATMIGIDNHTRGCDLIDPFGSFAYNPACRRHGAYRGRRVWCPGPSVTSRSPRRRDNDCALSSSNLDQARVGQLRRDRRWVGIPVLPAALGFYGAGIGLESIARGTLPLALFGSNGYAKLMGRLAMPSLIAQAAAPSVGALLLERYGAHGTLACLPSALDPPDVPRTACMTTS